MLSGKTILIGITGAIAAYKVCNLIRLFKKNNADVKVVVTPNALNFVTKTTLEALSQNPVNIEQFNVNEYKPEHIALTDETDIFVIAPASADTIAKMALGICDNLLTSTYCAYKKQVVAAPSMNTNMWENPAVKKNIEALKSYGVKIIEPEEGFLACGTNGKGRLADINVIYETVKNILVQEQTQQGKSGKNPAFCNEDNACDKENSLTAEQKHVFKSSETPYHDNIINPAAEQFSKYKSYENRDCSIENPVCYENNSLALEQILKGKKIVITAGGTREDIDTVRYIGNYSSGRMGIALADNAYRLGADVVLISTVEADKSYKVINVQTAQEMYNAVKEEFKTAGSLIMAAAVSDYRVKNKSEHKIKKDGNPLTIELVENPDILMEMSKIKRENQIVTGFCAESENLLENAKAKILKKHCDYICANDISRKDIGFASSFNELYIIDSKLNVFHIDRTNKQEAAYKILEKIYGKSK